MDEVFDTRTEITASCPNIFNKSDFFRVNLELLSKPSVVELHTFVLEKYELPGFVEHLYAHHDKTWKMSASQSDVVKIVESETELRTDEWIGGRIHLSSDTVRLETKDTCGHVINIVTPTSNYRVSIDLFAWNASTCERAFKSIPSFAVGYFFLQTDSTTLANEAVLSSATE